MNEPDPNAMPWWKSRIVLGIILSLVTKALLVTGVLHEAVSTEQQQAMLDAGLLILGGAGDLFAVLKRVQQTSAPALTLSNAKARELNAAPTPADPTEGGEWPLHDDVVRP